jgi:hypothetical protein
MAISENLFRAILSMDAYNRGYGRSIESAALSGTAIGKPTGTEGSCLLERSSHVVGISMS